MQIDFVGILMARGVRFSQHGGSGIINGALKLSDLGNPFRPCGSNGYGTRGNSYPNIRINAVDRFLSHQQGTLNFFSIFEVN